MIEDCERSERRRRRQLRVASQSKRQEAIEHIELRGASSTSTRSKPGSLQEAERLLKESLAINPYDSLALALLNDINTARCQFQAVAPPQPPYPWADEVNKWKILTTMSWFLSMAPKNWCHGHGLHQYHHRVLTRRGALP